MKSHVNIWQICGIINWDPEMRSKQ